MRAKETRISELLPSVQTFETRISAILPSAEAVKHEPCNFAQCGSCKTRIRAILLVLESVEPQSSCTLLSVGTFEIRITALVVTN